MLKSRLSILSCGFALVAIGNINVSGQAPSNENDGGAALAIKPPNPMRPTTITWGGFSHNDQLIGADAKWPFVQKYMDGFLMHGAYWRSHSSYWGKVNEDAVAQAERALGEVLAKNGKTATVEAGLGAGDAPYDPAHPETMEAWKSAQGDIAKFREFARDGIQVSKVRLDWFPTGAAAVMATRYQVSSMKEILAMVTGADAYYGTVPGFDPKNANWRQYTREIHQAFPNIEFGFDQAPCNFDVIPPDPNIRSLVPWEGLGHGYGRPLTFFSSKKPVLVNGKPVTLHIDFADLMMPVELSTRDAGLNFYAFEADTPYDYVVRNGKASTPLLQLLINIERMQHRFGFHSGKIINTSSGHLDQLSHDAWDKEYHDESLKFLELYQGAGGRSDQYIFESWYRGPFTLFPETKDGTFSNLARDAIRRVRGIDDAGVPFHAELAIRKQGDTAFIGDHVYQLKADGAQIVHYSWGNADKAITFELQIRNDGREVNKGDCRATPLLRATESNPADWKITYATPQGTQIGDQVLAQKDADGYFVGGLEPGQTKIVLVTISPAEDRNPPGKCDLDFQLYWNPQDPKGLVRDALSLQITGS